MNNIIIKPQKMNAKIMDSLEQKGLIIRMMPSRDSHRLAIQSGEARGEYMYKSMATSGTHALMNVALDNTDFINFGTHPDNEEFLLLGGIGEKSLLLLVSYLSREELERKIAAESLTSQDFICLDVVFNDPELSFFVMKKEVPHGECSMGSGLPATFYVTEGSNLSLDKTDFKNYSLCIES